MKRCQGTPEREGDGVKGEGEGEGSEETKKHSSEVSRLMPVDI